MAQYESILKLRGSIDNLVFYQLNGVNVVRKKSGFNSKDFQKKSSYKKVRENSSEFGHCSKVGKMLREVLAEYLMETGDKYLYQKFAKLMTEIKDCDTQSERGKRSVKKGLETEIGRNLIRNFNFGQIENIEKTVFLSEELFSNTILLKTKTEADEICVVSIHPNFENYSAEKMIQNIAIKTNKNTYEFEKTFQNFSPLLYFIVLKKDNKILKMGFV